MSGPLPAPRPVYLPGAGPSADPIFGLFHAVGAGCAPSTAVLICPPFGWEDVCSHRSARDWAIQLAGAGYPTLRIDLPGTCDSGGSPRDPGRLAAWTDAASVAAVWLRGATRCELLAAVGIGLGGQVICNAIAAQAPIDEVILWAVPSRGRRIVRELRTFASLQVDSEATTRDGQSRDAPEHGSTVAGGFVLSAETTSALESLDLATLPFPPGRPRRALLLGRDGIEVDARLRSHFEQSGTVVSIARGDGYGAMMTKPEKARAPTEVFAQVEAWLEMSVGNARGHPRASQVASTGQASFGDAAETIELRVADARIRETPLRVVQPFGALFGILCEPADVPAGELCVLMLNAGAIRHIGPNRMWVDTARRWAARGISTLRLDLEGLGEADGDASRFADVGTFYIPGLVDQVRAALDVLAARGQYRRFILGGLCSGASWSFQGALQDPRVVAAFMLNPSVLFWDPSLGVIRGVRRGLLRPSSWRKVLRQEVPLSRVVALIRKTPATLAGFPRRRLARRRARGADGSELDRALDQLRTADKHILFVFSENEPLYEELKRDGQWDQRDRWPNVTFEFIPGRDHTLRPIESQRHAHDVLDRALDRELAREASLPKHLVNS